MHHNTRTTAPTPPRHATAPRLRHLQPDGLYDARPNGYTHVVTTEAPARWVFVSGQGGEDQQAQLPDDFAAQARQALANLQRALRAAGSDMDQVAKLTLLIVDHSMERFNDWQAAVRLYWGDGAPGNGAPGDGAPGGSLPLFPACTLIPVPKLALPGMLIEVDAVALLPDTPATGA